MGTKNILSSGDLNGGKALILVHGRGGSAADILSLKNYLKVADFALFAPEAENNSWYPYSFLAPLENNEPQLSAGLRKLNELTGSIIEKGISSENIYFLGFSQGACLTLEYVTRNAQKYGGIVAFTGGLIGEKINYAHYSGDFNKTPVLITTGDPDSHVPVERVKESVEIIRKMGAEVTLKVYEGKPHSISPQEIEETNKIIFEN